MLLDFVRSQLTVVIPYPKGVYFFAPFAMNDRPEGEKFEHLMNGFSNIVRTSDKHLVRDARCCRLRPPLIEDPARRWDRFVQRTQLVFHSGPTLIVL